MHMSTLNEAKTNNLLANAPETMKNIPSPESFISGVLTTTEAQNFKEENKYLKNELETIKDDHGSEFHSDEEFDEKSESINKKQQRLNESKSSVSSSSESVEGEETKTVFHKQDTLGVKNLE
jgi:predicted RNase H-like nuclease (RuvC/YqgF family)